MATGVIGPNGPDVATLVAWECALATGCVTARRLSTAAMCVSVRVSSWRRATQRRVLVC